ncbi:MAG: hypothetical protein GOMPHAMPRED_003492 [Gomphillus americanus]|uniref:Cupredoxin n=1 Tax=Gomphillus americanus TaxID=1940652 RepID=A0A8H3FLA2_9LECA|nr:MAG: hypothetical protein GOMPHAMPRED_003492 [Gomphillus americanus]
MYKSVFLAVLSTAFAANIDIQVGASGLVYTPSKVTAKAGDTLTFHYATPFHSVTQSSFDAPCHHLDGGFNSGIVQVPAKSPTFVVTVKDSNPIWVYCSQVSHCQSGMAMVVNEPSGKTLEMYQSAAQNAAQETADPTVSGGVLGGAGGSSGSSSSSSVSSAVESSSMASVSSSSASVASSMSSTPAESTSASTPVSSMTSSSMTTDAGAAGTPSSSTTAESSTSTPPPTPTGAASHERGDLLALMGAAAFALLL